MLSLVRRLYSTILILPSAEKCRRIAGECPHTCSSGFLVLEDYATSSFLRHYDEHQITPSDLYCGADDEQIMRTTKVISPTCRQGVHRA